MIKKGKIRLKTKSNAGFRRRICAQEGSFSKVTLSVRYIDLIKSISKTMSFSCLKPQVDTFSI